jgi:hypothetical protein
MKKIQLFFILLSISFAIVSCKKGDTGDTGPAGATGAQGPSGTTGASTQYYTINPGDWNGALGNNYKLITDSAVTDTSKQMVLIYYNASSGWQALPSNAILFTGDNMGFSYAPYQVELFYHYPSSVPTLSITIKVVVIQTAGRPVPIDYRNYEAVELYYHIKD